MDMFHRRFRSRSKRKSYKSQIMHLPSDMGTNLLAANSLVFVAAVAANYQFIGQGLGADTFENADRLSNVVVGSDILSIIFNIDVRNNTGDGSIEYAILKVERAHVVPNTDGVLLPTDADIITLGLQASVRQYQPGRVIKFGTFSVAKEQPRSLSIKGNFVKFKMGRMRTGDFYLLVLFNRTSQDCTVDIQSRYLAKL